MAGVRGAGIVLGLSLGGFFDGIVLHQILQWHHMLSSAPDPAVRGDLALNITADGLFHAATYVFAVAGLWLLWRARGAFAAPRSGRVLAGGILMGAGLFNLVEGVVNHHLLGLHHVRTDTDHVLAWDLGFLVLGAALALGGWRLSRPATVTAR